MVMLKVLVSVLSATYNNQRRVIVIAVREKVT
jgi:hypothetical protein